MGYGLWVSLIQRAEPHHEERGEHRGVPRVGQLAQQLRQRPHYSLRHVVAVLVCFVVRDVARACHVMGGEGGG
jgi:hypothetical protein